MNSNIAVLNGFSWTPWLLVWGSVRPLFIFGAIFDSNEECCAKWQRYSAEMVFSSPLEQRSSVSQRCLTRFSEALSIDIKISPQPSSSDPGHLRVYMHSSAAIKVKLLVSKHFSAFCHDGEKQCQLLSPPHATSFLSACAGCFKAANPKVSDPLCFHWQLILIKRSFGFWFIS